MQRHTCIKLFWMDSDTVKINFTVWCLRSGGFAFVSIAQQADERRVSYSHIRRPHSYILFIRTKQKRQWNECARRVWMHKISQSSISRRACTTYFATCACLLLFHFCRSGCARARASWQRWLCDMNQTESHERLKSNAFNSINASAMSNEDFIRIAQI